MGVKIIATGMSVPDYCVSNHDLRQFFETSDEWIQQRTGIQSRRISQSKNTSDLGYHAAKQALDRAGIDAQSLDFIIVATMSADYNTPSTACLIQARLGADHAFAFDINAACSGFIYALHVAERMMNDSKIGYGLVIGSEVMSKLLDWTDRSTAILFGDGAGCVLLEQGQQQAILAQAIHSDGQKALALQAKENPVNNPFVKAQETYSFLTMQGREIFDFATRQVPALMIETLQQTHYTLKDVDYFLMHQANIRIIEIVAKKLGVPLDKFPMNLASYGNTSAASIPILLDELVTQGTITLNGDHLVLMAGFGAGLTWGSLLVRL